MIAFIRSLPQGVFWYPLALVLVSALARLIFTMGRFSHRQRASEKPVPVQGRYTQVIALAKTDAHAREELERLCVGLLLEASGYGTYSVERCRALKAEVAGSELEQALADHLGDLSAPASAAVGTGEGEARQSPAPSAAVAAASDGIGALPPVCRIVIRELERRTEE